MLNTTQSWTTGTAPIGPQAAQGRHLGITKLKKLDAFVLIHGTQWQGEQDTAEIVTDEEALQSILRAGQEKLLNEPKYSRLKELWESQKDEEE